MGINFSHKRTAIWSQFQFTWMYSVHIYKQALEPGKQLWLRHSLTMSACRLQSVNW